MTVYSAFNELEGLTANTDDTLNVSSTDASVALAGINRAGLRVNGALNTYIAFSLNDLAEGWCHIRALVHTDTNGVALSNGIQVRDPAGNMLLRIRVATGGAGSNKVLNVARFGDATGVDTAINAQTVQDFNIQWKIDATTGILRVYAGVTLIYEFLGNTSAGGGDQAHELRIHSSGLGTTTDRGHYGHFVVASTPTFGARVYTLVLASEATQTAWEGNVPDISGLTLDSGAAMSATVANQTSTFNITTLPTLPDGVGVNAIFVNTFSRYATASDVPDQVAVVDIGGTLYESSPEIITGNPAAKTIVHVFELDPATGVGWTVANVNAARFGIRAKA